MKKYRILFFVIAYSLMIVFTLIGLMFKVKTDSLNIHIQKVSQQMEVVKKENARFALRLAKSHSLDTIQRHAVTALRMNPPSEIKYFFLPPEALSENVHTSQK